jgi:hypothetical protein
MVKKLKSRSSSIKFGIHIPIESPSEYYVYPNGVYFFRFVSSPWSMLISKSSNKKYYYNCATGESTYDAPTDDSFCASPK